MAESPRAIQQLRPDPQLHVVLLAMSSVAILLASVLSVRDRTKVVVPVLDAALPEICLTRRTLKVDCPGCGMTRCFISLAHGDLAAAWSYNPAGLLMFPIVALQIPFRAAQLWRIRRGRAELTTGWLPHVALAALAAAMIGQWALRLIGIAF